MQNEWIVISEYCDKCHIEPTFIDMLCESGLIDVEQEGGERYLPFSELPDVERYSRMYYDLSINMEGIDAIHHLLARICLLYTSPSPRDRQKSRMPSSA